MTREEAIKRIQDCMRVHKIGEYPHIRLKEDLDMVISALRVQQTTLDRSKWAGCIMCNEKFCETCRHSTYETWQEPCVSCMEDSFEGKYTPMNFCPNCGRPLTEEAWAELERRIG